MGRKKTKKYVHHKKEAQENETLTGTQIKYYAIKILICIYYKNDQGQGFLFGFQRKYFIAFNLYSLYLSEFMH